MGTGLKAIGWGKDKLRPTPPTPAQDLSTAESSPFPSPPRRPPRPGAEPIVNQVEKREGVGWGREREVTHERQRKAGGRSLLPWELSSRLRQSCVIGRWGLYILRMRGHIAERGKNANLGQKWVQGRL